jgi:hypothetical protein
VPEQPVETLMLPLNAPWSKAAEVADYVREVRPTRVFDIHDALLNDTGLGLYGTVINNLIPADRRHLAPGAVEEL